jgi:hypothetical protein
MPCADSAVATGGFPARAGRVRAGDYKVVQWGLFGALLLRGRQCTSNRNANGTAHTKPATSIQTSASASATVPGTSRACRSGFWSGFFMLPIALQEMAFKARPWRHLAKAIWRGAFWGVAPARSSVHQQSTRQSPAAAKQPARPTSRKGPYLVGQCQPSANAVSTSARAWAVSWPCPSNWLTSSRCRATWAGVNHPQRHFTAHPPCNASADWREQVDCIFNLTPSLGHMCRIPLSDKCSDHSGAMICAPQCSTPPSLLLRIRGRYVADVLDNQSTGRTWTLRFWQC